MFLIIEEETHNTLKFHFVKSGTSDDSASVSSLVSATRHRKGEAQLGLASGPPRSREKCSPAMVMKPRGGNTAIPILPDVCQALPRDSFRTTGRDVVLLASLVCKLPDN